MRSGQRKPSSKAPRSRGADKRGADKRGADKRGADKRGADKRGADKRGADKRGVVRRRVGVAAAAGVSVALVGFLFAFYFPTRTWLSQRHSTRNATEQLDALTNANRALAAQAKALQDPAVIARIARDEYGMVKPGEKAYVVLPPPAAPTALPKVWPFELSTAPTGPNAAQGEVAAGGVPPSTPTTG